MIKKSLFDTENLSAVLPKEYLIQSIADLYEHGLPKGLYTGLECLDNLARLDTGRLCVITGIPNDGKSEFVDFLTTAYNRRYGMKTIYFSPENQPVALHVAKLISKLSCKRFSKKEIAPDELRNAVSYIGDNFFFCNYQKVKTSTQILSLAKEQIDKTGAKILVIDAFNKIESESGTDDNLLFISRLLDAFCNFAIKENVLIILVAHPRKMETGTNRVPNPYDINGSANFFNKSDFVFTVQRNRRDADDTSVIVKVGKVKFSNYGKQGQITLDYDVASGNYTTCSWDSTNDVFDDDADETTTSYLPEPFNFPIVVEPKEPLDVQVSQYRGATDNVGERVSLKDFLFTDKYKDIAEYIRKGETPEQRKERKHANKDRIPCATISGTFSQRGAKYLDEPSGLLSIDIDYIDNKEIMDKVPSILRGLDYITYFAKSISGDGYFAICKIAEPSKIKEHFFALEKEFKQLGITLDKSCKDISRLRFATYDENAYYNPKATTFLFVVDDTKPAIAMPEFVSSHSSETDAELVEKHIKLLKDNNLSIADDYKTWFDIGMSLNAAFGENGRQYFHSLSALSPKYDKWECDEQYDKILERYSSDSDYTLGTLIHYLKQAENNLNN